jgi:beta-glucosidase
MTDAVIVSIERSRMRFYNKMARMKRKQAYPAFAVILALAAIAVNAAPADDIDKRAIAVEKSMTNAERTVLTNGVMPLPFRPQDRMPEGAIIGGGYVPGIARLGIPALTETDAGLGVGWVMGLRKDDGATALPSGTALGATWNAALLRRAGAMVGSEARAKGFNVLLAGGINLMRDPRNGRTFEYLGEDPLHSGILAGESIVGIQSNHIISTVKHFALNGQETGRNFVNAVITEAAARESDLLAFQIAIERGQPGAVMCAYNRVNGHQACGSDWLLNQVLKRDWGYKGFVMSDWGAVHAVDFALKGLDQQSGSQLDPRVYLGPDLAVAAAHDPAYTARLSDMNRRILRSIFAVGADKHPAIKQPINFNAGAAVAEQVAREGIVLLRNQNNALPLAANARKIAVIGGRADTGVLSGAGSSQVHSGEGPALYIPLGGSGPFAGLIGEAYHRSNPLAAIKARAPQAVVKYRSGQYLTDAVTAAKSADVAIVFATQWQSEGFDQPDLNLPNGQDELIAAVAAANPNTIVVLETGSAVAMPWLDKTAAVVEAWYPGIRGGEAIAAVLFGDVNPSGRLPITFPASLNQLPRPKLDGMDTVEPEFTGKGQPGQSLDVNYDIEGSDVGYRWFARTGAKPLFSFGHGLSYTSFAHSRLQIAAGMRITATFTVTNTGTRAGADVPQLYLVSVNGRQRLRLAAFDRVELAAGASKTVTVTVDPRVLADWKGASWQLASGRYTFALAASANDIGPQQSVTFSARTWRP